MSVEVHGCDNYQIPVRMFVQQETYFTAGKNAHWYNHGGAQSAVSYKVSPHSYHVIQQSCSLIFTQMNGKLCSV